MIILNTIMVVVAAMGALNFLCLIGWMVSTSNPHYGETDKARFTREGGEGAAILTHFIFLAVCIVMDLSLLLARHILTLPAQ